MCSSYLREDDAWWVSTEEFLPNIGEKVLIISKWGRVSNAMFREYLSGKLLFSPDGLEPGKDVKWWMPLPTDGWNNAKDVKPKENEAILMMGIYGNICSGIWKRAYTTGNLEFFPFVMDVLYWRTMPRLPDGVVLKS